MYGKKWNEPKNIIHKQCFRKNSSQRSDMLRDLIVFTLSVFEMLLLFNDNKLQTTENKTIFNHWAHYLVFVLKGLED